MPAPCRSPAAPLGGLLLLALLVMSGHSARVGTVWADSAPEAACEPMEVSSRERAHFEFARLLQERPQRTPNAPMLLNRCI